MEDLAKEVIGFLEDRPSKLQLVSRGRDYNHPNDSFRTPKFRDVLRVSAPVEKGQLVFKVSYIENRDRNSTDWMHLQYLEKDIEGVVGFIDAFLRPSASGSDSIEVANTASGTKVGIISLETRHDEQSTRLKQIRNAVKSLCGK